MTTGPTEDVTGVALAAGLGSRLGDASHGLPKAIIPVAGTPLAGYTLRYLRAAGITDVLLVAGFAAADVAAAVKRLDPAVTIRENPDFRKGNLFSLRVAFDATRGGLLVMNIDHLYGRSSASGLREGMGEEMAIYCDFGKRPEPDERVVVLRAGHAVRLIGKGIPDADAVCTGISFIPRAKRGAYLAAASEAVEKYGDAVGYEDVFQVLADRGETIRAVDFSGALLAEIDTPDELTRADSILAADPTVVA